MSITRSYLVVGMSCGHCVGTVTTEIEKIGGVTGVDINLVANGPADVKVISDDRMALEDIRIAVDAAGYELAEGPQ